ncbi:hypothetical protein J7413_00720 [Shimia sp. R10_1]|uniref:hypothetical protein n=1 Tax=Shimia sp. R10_1 TaxID=2821095 RepID=UPI001ADA4CF1|nr:hypothetical protein [Shimia sp. R10_1]MBO9472050.1 hypothetical protein [Shimia sp. R10_1]
MKVIKDLLIALINATLILVALCLFLLWQLSGTAERVVAEFAENLQIVKPMEERVQSLQSEVVGLREDLANLSLESAALNLPATQALATRADALQAELEAINSNLQTLAETPDRLMSEGVERLSARASEGLGKLAACHLPDSVDTPGDAATVDTAPVN